MAGKVITIWTSKGGVGKTLVSTNLALQLVNPLSQVKNAWKFDTDEGALQTKAILNKPDFTPSKVCFIDSDGLRSGFTLLGAWTKDERDEDQAPDSKYTLADLYEEKVGIEGLFNPSDEAPENLFLINADTRLGDSTFIVNKILPRPDLTAALFKDLRKEFDYIVIDTPYQATADGFPKAALKHSDGILLLATPNSSDLHGYLKSIETIEEVLGTGDGWAKILGTVLNRTQSRPDEAGKNMGDENEDEVLIQVKAHQGKDRILSIIPETAYQRSSQRRHQTLFSYARYSPPSRELLRVACEIRKRLA